MGKFLSFGKNNKQYKYIWIYVIIRLLNDYIFSGVFPAIIKPDFLAPNNFPPNILNQIFFYYLGAFIFSFIFNLYLKSQLKGAKKEESQIHSDTYKKYELIYYIYEPDIEIKTIFFTSILSIIAIETIICFAILGFMGLLYWVFDLFFVAYINLLIFEIPIYSHKKCAILFIIIFSSLFKLLSTLEYISNNNYNLLYKNHIILIPIIVVFYLLISLMRFYSLCKIKWILDFKFIPERIFFVIYNFFGMIILLIACLIANFVKCADKAVFNDIDLICLIKIETGNKMEYYYDNFSYFFRQLWQKDKTIIINILYLILFLFHLFLNALRLLYSILIIKHLSPEYYYCSFEIYCSFIRLLCLINTIIYDGDVKTEIYNILAELGSLIGICIYLELIELKFCNLNHNLRKNNETRSITDYNINNLYDEISNSDD